MEQEVIIYEPQNKRGFNTTSKEVRILNTENLQKGYRVFRAVVSFFPGAANQVDLKAGDKVTVYKLPVTGSFIVSKVTESLNFKPFNVSQCGAGHVQFSSSRLYGALPNGLYTLESQGVSSITGNEAFKLVRHGS